MRKHLALVLLLVVPVGLFASAQEESPAKTTELRFAWWGNPVRDNLTNQVIALYEAANPGIRVKAEPLGWDAYWEKLATQVAAKTLPDVIQQDLEYLTQYVDNALLADLEPFVGDGSLDLRDMSASALGTGKVGGKLYAVVAGINALCMMYNPDLFKAAGVPLPTVAWTWKDFEDACRSIHQTSGVYGCDFIGTDIFPIWLREHGADMVSEDGKALGYQDDALYSEYLSIMLRLQESGAMPGPDYHMETGENIATWAFSRDQAAMGFIYSNQLDQVYQTRQKDTELALVPGPNNDKGMYVNPSMFFSITAISARKTEAAKFISFLMNDVQAGKILKGNRGVPPMSKVRDAVAAESDSQQKKVLEYISLVGEHSGPISPVPPSGELLEAYYRSIEEAMFGRTSPAEAAAKFRDESKGILSR